MNLRLRIRGTRPQRPANALPMLWNEFACLDFVDSQFNEHTGERIVFDRLPLSDWQRAFLSRWGWSARVPATPRELATLRALRLRLRRVIEAASRGERIGAVEIRGLNQIMAGSPYIHAIDRDRQIVDEPLRRNWDWVAAELVRSAIEMVARDAARIKVCSNPECSWIFFDTSLNRSRRWCQSSICGNLIKVREFRARQRRRPRGSRRARHAYRSPVRYS